MNMKQIKKAVCGKEYDFLRTNPHLGGNIILLGLGGSHAYGTNLPGSDLDIRGIAVNSKDEILLGRDFEQVTNDVTDTTIYSLKKMVSLLSNCNPNTIEILGLKPEQYLYISPIGKLLLDNKSIFLSKRAINSFGGYANQQLYRLNQKSASALSQKDLEEHILKTLKSMEENFKEMYSDYPGDAIRLYTDKAVSSELESEIFMDVTLTHYPLRDYACLWNELQTTVSQYNKVGKRNAHAIEHGRLSKHMMHLIRLYLMCLDILEKGEINTYREKEHNLLMSIRNGDFLTPDGQPIPEFFDMVRDYEKKLDYAKMHTNLPDEPDYDAINELVKTINECVVRNVSVLTKEKEDYEKE